MHTVILNGSPHPGGDTMTLVHALTADLQGETTVIDCYRTQVVPCCDCRMCRTADGCAIADGMQDIYRMIEACDRLVLSSPVHYAALSGALLTLVSRFQCYDSARRFRHTNPAIKPKKAAVILTCGCSGGAEAAYQSAKIILRSIGAAEIFPLICSGKTDTVPASEDAAAIAAAKDAATWFRGIASR